MGSMGVIFKMLGLGGGIKLPDNFLLPIQGCTFFMFMPFSNSGVALNIGGFGKTPS